MLNKSAALIALVGFLVIPGGCLRILGTAMVTPPNKVSPVRPVGRSSPPARQALGIDQEFQVTTTSPKATLRVSILEPEVEDGSRLVEPKGTVLVLHGFWSSGFWMLRTAHLLAESGYRAVLVDLRGHGQSTGEGLTFGPREARDLSQVVDELAQRDLLAGKLGVYGISYGATTAIHLAAIDRRVAGVVAVAPFSAMRAVVPDYARTALPGIERGITDQTLQRAVDRAGEKADFDPDLSNAIAAIQQTTSPVLIMHGTDDWLVPPYHAMRLYSAAQNHARLLMLPKLGHISIWFDVKGEVADETLRWFEKTLRSS